MLRLALHKPPTTPFKIRTASARHFNTRPEEKDLKIQVPSSL